MRLTSRAPKTLTGSAKRCGLGALVFTGSCFFDYGFVDNVLAAGGGFYALSNARDGIDYGLAFLDNGVKRLRDYRG